MNNMRMQQHPLLKQHQQHQQFQQHFNKIFCLLHQQAFWQLRSMERGVVAMSLGECANAWHNLERGTPPPPPFIPRVDTLPGVATIFLLNELSWC